MTHCKPGPSHYKTGSVYEAPKVIETNPRQHGTEGELKEQQPINSGKPRPNPYPEK